MRDHLEDFVAIKTQMKAGVVMVTPRFGGERPLSEDWRLYYVHPRTGLLRKNEKWKTWSARQREAKAAADAERHKRMRVIDAKTQLHLLDDGGWWEVKLAKMGPPLTPYEDVVRRAKLSSMALSVLYARDGVYARDKRQLPKSEIKKLALR